MIGETTTMTIEKVKRAMALFREMELDEPVLPILDPRRAVVAESNGWREGEHFYRMPTEAA